MSHENTFLVRENLEPQCMTELRQSQLIAAGTSPAPQGCSPVSATRLRLLLLHGF